jgi:site-specific DNA-methyltransferase (adenine-specific)
MSEITLHIGDCLDIMPTLPQVEAIITDLPYGTTACSWDEIIPFEPMWEQVKRILKPRGVFVTTASQPFTSKLVMSNLEWFKYCWVWNKKKPAGFQLAKVRPMMVHEEIAVFSKNGSNYYPIKCLRQKIKRSRTIGYSESSPLKYNDEKEREYTDFYPKSIIDVSNANQNNRVHPTQKPVALYEYLIRTYTNEGDTVLDLCSGSGTTGVACVNTGRNCILIEKEEKYFEIAQKRIHDAQQQMRLPI